MNRRRKLVHQGPFILKGERVKEGMSVGGRDGNRAKSPTCTRSPSVRAVRAVRYRVRFLGSPGKTRPEQCGTWQAPQNSISETPATNRDPISPRRMLSMAPIVAVHVGGGRGLGR